MIMSSFYVYGENFNVWHWFLLSRNKVVVGEPAAGK
jgi:hypothetical protein